jgi:hypothetical protein
MIDVETPYHQSLKELRDFRPLFNVGELADVPKKEGVYALWWKNESKTKLKNANRKVSLKGRRVSKKKTGTVDEHQGHHLHEVVWDWNLDEPMVCLYVGKSTNILQRIKWHLLSRVPSEEWNKPVRNKKKEVVKEHIPGFVYKRDSMCQFRAGFEHLGFNFDDIKSNVFISYALVPKKHNSVADRFYLEDLAIGLFRPWFNVDSER